MSNIKKVLSHKAIFLILLLISLFLSTPTALISGIALSYTGIFYKPPQLTKLRKYTLETAVVLLGFGLNITEVLEVGSKGLLQTGGALIVLLVAGYFLSRALKLDKNIGTLISCGTAICGGSAIAAVAPVIDADDSEIAVATGVVFILNAVALFIFPILGRMLNMTAESFGMWAALSIHDTSSVVGAAAAFSPEALKIATLIKLTRTLWIIPMALAFSLMQGERKSIKLPVFIAFFLIASAIASVFPWSFYREIFLLGKRLMAPALFMVGYSINPGFIKKVGARGLSFGGMLWIASILLGYLLTIIISI